MRPQNPIDQLVLSANYRTSQNPVDQLVFSANYSTTMSTGDAAGKEEKEEEDKETEDKEDTEDEEDKKEQPAPQLRSVNSILKDSGQKSSIRQPYGMGSKSTIQRTKRKLQDVRTEAKKSLSIQGVFKSQVDLGLGLNTKSSSAVSRSLDSVKQGYSIEEEENPTHDRDSALEDLEYLLSHKTEQLKKYSQVSSPNSNFLRRHETVLRLLRIQKHKEKYPEIDRRGFATIVANVDNWGESTGRSMIQWENSWVQDQIVPESQAGKNAHTFSWMDDKDLILDIGVFNQKSGESMIIISNTEGDTESPF